MKILHIITTINRGGAENHLFVLIKGLVSLGFDVSVAYLKGDGYWSKFYNDIGVKVHPLNLDYYGQLKPLTNLSNLLKNNKFDIIHAHLPPAEFYAYFAILISRVNANFIISKHNDEPFYKYYFTNYLAKILAKKSTKVVAISHAVKNYFVALNVAPKEKIEVIHYGFDYSSIYLSAVSNRISLNGGEVFTIGTVARLAEQKSLHILIRAYKKFISLSNLNSSLVIVGDGPLRADLINLTVKLGIKEKVKFLGYREDAALLISNFDIFALTSVYEGFGLVLLEAMSQRRAIVASRVSAIPEIVVDKVTGILIEPGHIDGFCDAFLSLQNPKIRDDLGNAGFNRMINNFSVSSMVNKTAKLYTA